MPNKGQMISQYTVQWNSLQSSEQRKLRETSGIKGHGSFNLCMRMLGNQAITGIKKIS